MTPRVVVKGRGIRWECTGCYEPQTVAPSGDTLTCDRCIDAGRRGEPFIPLTVKMTPAKGTPDLRPVVAVCVRDFQCVTEDGETFDLEELSERLRPRKAGERGRARLGVPDELPPAIVVTDQGVDLLAWLDNGPCGRDPFWQWQVALTEMSAWRPEAGRVRRRRAVALQPRPMRFGFSSRKGASRRAHSKARWYQVIDVHRFCELPDGWGDLDARALLRFGVQVRDWCNMQHLPVGSSGSAIGSRLLRDERFGAGWRRKIPAATNARARTMLPGNHYQLLTVSGKRFPEAHKFDMRRAHHWAALTGGFPHPDLLNAEGWFRHMPHDGQTAGPIKAGSPRWRMMVARPGMFIARVHVPERVALDVLEIPALRRRGERWVVLSSDEIDYVRRHGAGVRLGDVWAAWTSPEVDERLNEYSWWAQTELSRPGAPAWLKPTLLSPYGLLAAKARKYRSAWRWTSRSEGEIGWPTAHGELVGMEREAGKAREPAHTNVIWRCLIEARVRMEALRFAREIRGAGARPLAVYADAVFATAANSPFQTTALPEPWRCAGVIHDLTFDGAQRYRAREETRLPGTPGERTQLTKAI
jgi:hypothetical protein